MLMKIKITLFTHTVCFSQAGGFVGWECMEKIGFNFTASFQLDVPISMIFVVFMEEEFESISWRLEDFVVAFCPRRKLKLKIVKLYPKICQFCFCSKSFYW